MIAVLIVVLLAAYQGAAMDLPTPSNGPRPAEWRSNP